MGNYLEGTSRFAIKVPVLPHLVNNYSGSNFLLNSTETSTKVGAL